MRMSISSPGNDFRLGACEAPPAIVSTYLGDDMTTYMDAFAAGASAPYDPGTKTFSLGVEGNTHLSEFSVPAEDRKRTSPFPYGGARFEYRAVGSTQNVSMVNTVLNTLAAEGFKTIADRVEAGENIADVARDLYTTHKRAVFNGNGYDPAWPEEATKRGIWRIDSGVDAIQTLTSAKNIEIFGTHNIFTAEELAARQEVLLDHYTGTVEMEALCMIDMIKQHVIPSVKSCGMGPLAELEASAATLEADVASIHAAGTAEEKGALSRVLRLETMIEIRDICDAAEAVVPAEEWTLATYNDLLFMDMYPNSHDLQ